MSRERAETIDLLGGALCLDFANSVSWAADGSPRGVDPFGDGAGVVAWGRRQGLLARRAAVSADAGEPERAARLRAALHRAFSAVAAGEQPDRGALDELRAVHEEAATEARIVQAGGAFALAWDPRDARSVRLAAAASAVQLLTDPERLERVRLCPGHDCGWVFLDTSGRRRWCSMAMCGSREKMRRLYARQRAAAAGA